MQRHFSLVHFSTPTTADVVGNFFILTLVDANSTASDICLKSYPVRINSVAYSLVVM